MKAFFAGASRVLALRTLAMMLAGAIAGIIAAAIPGFTLTMAIVLTLPLIFTMEPLQGIAMMLPVHVGGYTRGLISAAVRIVAAPPPPAAG